MSDSFVVEQVTNYDDMFYGCIALLGANGTEFDNTHVDKTYARLDDPDGGNPGYLSDCIRVMLFDDATATTFNECIEMGIEDIGNIIPVPDEPTKVGYNFKGWYKTTDTDDDANKWNFATDILPGNMKLYAGWDEVNTYWYLTGPSTDYTLHLSASATAEYNAATIKGTFTKFDSGYDIPWYQGGYYITSVVIENEITPGGNSMAYWFLRLEYITSIDGLDKIDTSNVTNMEYMFGYSATLTYLDLSNFDTHNVTNMTNMFRNCVSLSTILVSDSFVVEQVTNSDDMFYGCGVLLGYNGTKCDGINTNLDKTYARLDDPEVGNPGYFSDCVRVMLYDDATATTFNECIELGIEDIGNIIPVPDEPTKVGYNFKGWYKATDSTIEANKWNFATDTLPGNMKLYAGWDDSQVPTTSPVISIMDVTGLPNPSGKGDHLFPVGTNFSTLDFTDFKVWVECEDGSDMWVKYTNDSANFSFPTTSLTAGATTIQITYRGQNYDIENCFVYRDTDGYDITGVSSPHPIYLEGETFDPTEMEVSVEKFDGTTETIIYNTTTAANFTIPTEALAIGDTSVTIQYGPYSECTIDVPITVLKRATSFTLNDNAIDKYYLVGDAFNDANLHNLAATVAYEDGTFETINYDVHPEYFTFTPLLGTALTVNNDKITIKLQGATLDYPIVVEPTGNATSITVRTAPLKINYIAGDSFEPDGLVLNVTYAGGITKVIVYELETAENFSFSPDPFQTPPEELLYGDESVEVTYKGASTNIPIAVGQRATEIEVVTTPKYTFYSVGDKFDTTGLVIHVTYEDGTEEDIKYSSETAYAFMFNPPIDKVFDADDIGTTVTLSYANSPVIDVTGVFPIRNDSLTLFVYYRSDGSTSISYDMNENRSTFESELDNAIKRGAIGFYSYTAAGLNDAFKKYNYYATRTLTKAQALAKFDTYKVGDKLFIGAVYSKTTPTPTPSGGNSGGGGGGSTYPPTYDRYGNIQPGTGNNSMLNLNAINAIPQYKLIMNTELIKNLQSYQENVNASYMNAEDDSGNKGFGRWQHIPNTTTWYFLAGDVNANGTKGTAGFVSNGWYNLGWSGRDEWYHFDNNGVMQLGWVSDNGKTYYLEEDLSSSWYGRMAIGKKVINGVEYNFDANGALIQ